MALEQIRIVFDKGVSAVRSRLWSIKFVESDGGISAEHELYDCDTVTGYVLNTGWSCVGHPDAWWLDSPDQIGELTFVGAMLPPVEEFNFLYWFSCSTNSEMDVSVYATTDGVETLIGSQSGVSSSGPDSPGIPVSWAPPPVPLFWTNFVGQYETIP